jgi:hypothetical protein
MHLSGLDFFYWVTGLVGELALIGVLWRKHRAHQFPAFVALLVFYVVRTLTLFFIYRHGTAHMYANVYWTLAIVDVLLQLAMMTEIAMKVFRPTRRWASDVGQSLLGLVAISLLVAAGLTWLAAPPVRSWQQSFVLRGNLFSSILVTELFVGMMMLAFTAGLPWKLHAFRIAQGWGVYTMFSMLVDAVENFFGLATRAGVFHTLNHVRLGLFMVCLGFWIVTLWQEAPEPRELPARVNAQLIHLNRQTTALLQHLRPGGGNA